MRTGEWVVQLEGVEYLGSWEMSTGDFVVNCSTRSRWGAGSSELVTL